VRAARVTSLDVSAAAEALFPAHAIGVIARGTAMGSAGDAPR